MLVCEETIRKRLEEFQETKVAELTPDLFNKMDIEKLESQNPPSFKKKFK